MILIYNPFFIWFLLGVLVILIMWISPNRYEYFNDIKNFVYREEMNMLFSVFILYCYLPLFIIDLFKSFKK